MSETQERLTKAIGERYAIERELGHGGMATVYLGRDIRYDRTVAIKVLRPELAQALGGARFLREINISAQLQSPHILPLLDSGEADGLLYYVMPYVQGDSLRGLIARQGALAPSEAMRLLRDVVDGLAHAHRHGIVHRDIKPDNVMIADRHALVVDFGVAKAVNDATAHHDLTSIGISLGTPAYMAPEQAAADPAIDHRADLYSVGVLAYEMLSGKPPFSGTPQAVIAAHISQLPVPLLTARPDVPPALASIVMRLLEKDAANRYQTADELLVAIESLSTPAGGAAADAADAGARASRASRWPLALGAVAVVLLAYFGTARLRDDRWLHATALPQLVRLVEAAENDSAFALALRIEAVAPADSTLNALWPRFSRKVVLHSEPEGATVWRASLADTTQWMRVGVTPTDSVRLPIRTGLFRFEKAGFRPFWSLFSTPWLAPLEAEDAAHPEMVAFLDGTQRAFLVGADGAPPLPLDAFRMDRFEITNAQYLAFVNAGGYRDRAHWNEPIVDGARTIAFADAMAKFVDRTGRPGPATWEGGTFPAGQAEMPVGGVSWYEAAAYAKWAGKSLPTIYHWARVANIGFARYIVPLANLEGTGPLPVGTRRAVSIGGLSDLAGNVREWCANDAGRGQRYILGGGWSDPKYGFVDAYAQPPLDRSAINGIRLALFEPTDTTLVAASRPVIRAFTDWSKERPVSDAVFAGFLPQFDYDPAALDTKVELRDSTPEQWTAEKVSFTTAYGGRMSAWVYVPKRGTPPFQTVVAFPGSNALGAPPFTGALPSVMSFVPSSGRIMVYPIYQATHERSNGTTSDLADLSIRWRDHVVMWAKDYRRTLDYLSTRADVDTSAFAYFGFSWGGYMGGVIPAVEPRIKAVVLYVAGLEMERGRPEVEPFNFLGHITQPVIMLNGRHDFFFPVETAQKPFFENLGTPAARKRWTVYEGGHDVPRTELMRESMAWLDKYLGPVR